MSKFQEVKIVDNFYQNSLYFPMPTVAISTLAEDGSTTIGAYSLVTDDTKQGGPYMSLLQFDDDIMPFTFADVLILRYLVGNVDEHKTVTDFNLINNSSNLNWSFKSQVTKFIKRFLKDPYRSEDTEWIRNLAATKGFSIKEKMAALSILL